MFGMDYEETKKMDFEVLDKLRGITSTTSVIFQINHESALALKMNNYFLVTIQKLNLIVRKNFLSF